MMIDLNVPLPGIWPVMHGDMPSAAGPWPWISLVVLGAFHGVNPAMGWLFAVARGFQERRLRAVVMALGPITLGHALAIAVIAVPVGLLGFLLPQVLLLTLTGLVLLSFAGYKLATRFRHPRWVGLRLRPRELVLWSFLMATAHGAGLMLAPVLIRMRGEAVPGALAMSGHAGHETPGDGGALGPAVAAVTLHSAAMLAVALVLAVVVYRQLGVAVLRRAWINLDLVWVGALVITGGVTLGLGFWTLAAG